MAKPIPFDFVLDQLYEKSPRTRPMFGCTAVYVGEKIVLILRKKEDHVRDNGVWVCTSAEHHASLRSEFPCLRSLELFGTGETGWQNIPEESADFESTVLAVCELVCKSDSRIGRIPAKRRRPQKKSVPILKRTPKLRSASPPKPASRSKKEAKARRR